jgi:peptidoglycan/xylan/chitin deacetylase (PgdA/CDA1 family)
MSGLGDMRRALRERLPGPAANFMERVAFILKRRPIVCADDPAQPVHRSAVGSVTFSIDFELAWAWRYSKSGVDCVEMGLWEREQVPRLVRWFEEFRIPATWATVGHLFLDHCRRGPDGHAHPELLHPPYFTNAWWTFASGDWYQHDPCTDLRRDPAWYGPDLIELVMNSPVGHEIGCHSFSHAGFAEYCPAEVAASELDACLAVMRPLGLRPRSFVFPGNDAGNFAVLASRGFDVVRWFPHDSAEVALPVRRKDGAWGLHASAYLSGGKQGKFIPYVRRNIELCIDRAVAHGLNAHFWFHPSLSARECEEMLRPVLARCARLREQGLLEVHTMGQLVASLERAQHSLSRGES